jgi:hypothetical protein
MIQAYNIYPIRTVKSQLYSKGISYFRLWSSLLSPQLGHLVSLLSKADVTTAGVPVRTAQPQTQLQYYLP